MRTENVIILVGVIILFALLCVPLGGFLGWGMMGSGHMWRWNGGVSDSTWGLGMVIVMGLFWVLVLVALVFGVIWLARNLSSGQTSSDSRGDSALNILRERYARGELSKEEFDRMRQDLE